jgi:hypothetical protein
MQRLYFICQNTGKKFSATLDIPDVKPFDGIAFVHCRQCGEEHHVSGRDVVGSQRVSKPKRLRLLR